MSELATLINFSITKITKKRKEKKILHYEILANPKIQVGFVQGRQ